MIKVIKQIGFSCTAVMVIVVLFSAVAVAGDVDLAALTQETQMMSQKPDEITLAWWIPEEFWSASLAQTPGMTASQVEDFLKVVRPYTMVVVIKGKIGALAGITYESEDYLRANTRLVDLQGKSYTPLMENEFNADTKNLLQIMKPILVNMLGPMGQNMHFLIFPGKTETGVRIASAKDKGQFTVKIGEKEFKWRLPLDALLPSKTCSHCNETCKGSWSFCPWCGTKLVQK